MKNSTDISVILDRSGSMEIIKGETISSFNSFLREQKELDKPCKLSVYQFDTAYDTIYADTDIKVAPELNEEIYQPRGYTALLDAIGKTINNTGARLAKLKENERPNQVMIVIITDGEENASKKFNQPIIASLIKQQREKYSWEFIFLGANQDSVLTAKSYNLNTNNVLNFAPEAGSVQTAGGLLSKAITSYRSAGATNQDLFKGMADAAMPNNKKDSKTSAKA